MNRMFLFSFATILAIVVLCVEEMINWFILCRNIWFTAYVNAIFVPFAYLADCFPGTYKNTLQTDVCKACPVGTYNSNYRSAVCTECPDGFTTRGQETKHVTLCNSMSIYIM